MKSLRAASAALLTMAVASCGEPSVIDVVKDSSVAECSAATVGSMVINYFPRTTWTAYNGEEPGSYEVRGSGELQFVGMTQTAELRFGYNENSGQVTYLGASLNGQDQPRGMANQILEVMCQDARG